MAEQLTILPVITYPRNDELLSSWLYRLALENFTKAHTFCRFHLPGYQIWNRDIDKLASNKLIKRLSVLTGIPDQNIYQTTLRSYEGYLFEHCNSFGNQKWILPLKIFHRVRLGNGLQFCPKCLNDDGDVAYFRKSWRLGISVACIRCDILLHDMCPFCEKPINFFRNEIGIKHLFIPSPIYICYSCKMDLRKSPRYPARIGTTSFQKRVFKYLEDGHCKGIQYSIGYFDVLYQIIKILRSHRNKLKKFQEMICKYTGVNAIKRTSREFESESTITREWILITSIWLLDNWPNRFVNLCNEVKLSSNYILTDLKKPPFWFSSVVREKLHQPSASERSKLNKIR